MSEELRDYETLGIVNPDLAPEAVQELIGKTTSIIEGGGGSIYKVDEWGRRKLAYPIMKKNDGYYFLSVFSSPVAVKNEVERILRLNENVLRYQTILLSESDVELVKNSIAAAAIVAEEAEKAAAAAVVAEAEKAAAEAVEAEKAAAVAEAEPVTEEAKAEEGAGDE